MSFETVLPLITWGGYLVCLLYLTTLTIIFLALIVTAARENRERVKEASAEDFSIVRSSPFTIPVSVIAPAYNEEVCVSACVRSLLALDYPEYEVIVVNDGSTDGTLRRLTEDFDLQPAAPLYRRVIDTSEVQQIYRSRVDPRLTVIDKANGGKADALNAGANFARFRYLCCVDSDTVYHADAMLKGMRLVMPDPSRMVGVTSHVTLHSRPEHVVHDEQGRIRVDRNWLVTYQLLDYLRAFV